MKKYTLILALTTAFIISLPISVLAAGDAPDGAAGASRPVEPLEHYEPLPVKHHEPQANNTLLGGGLGVAAIAIGGAATIDKRRK